MTAVSVVLVTVTGRDQPGITSELTGVLAGHEVNILDIAQALIHPMLSLSILFETKKSRTDAILKDLQTKSQDLGLTLDHKVFGAKDHSESARRKHQYAITLIADAISATALHRITRTLAASKMNLDVIKRLSDDGFSCVEMQVSSLEEVDELKLKQRLLPIAWEQQLDIALQAEGLYRRAKRLVALDMDSTLIQSEVIDELAREKGAYDEVAAITHQAMHGKMSYDESLNLRCEKLKGLKSDALEKVFSRIQLTPGAEDLIRVLKRLGYRTAVISGGFTFVADRLKEKLGLDYAYANNLEMKNGALTGKVLPPIVNAQRKADLLDVIAQQEKISLDQVIAVGDGANDLLMLEKAGLGIAFNAKPAVRERADLALSQKSLKSILYLLGLSAQDLEQAGL